MFFAEIDDREKKIKVVKKFNTVLDYASKMLLVLSGGSNGPSVHTAGITSASVSPVFPVGYRVF